jgi:hypothetical protein
MSFFLLLRADNAFPTLAVRLQPVTEQESLVVSIDHFINELCRHDVPQKLAIAACDQGIITAPSRPRNTNHPHLTCWSVSAKIKDGFFAGHFCLERFDCLKRLESNREVNIGQD